MVGEQMKIDKKEFEEYLGKRLCDKQFSFVGQGAYGKVIRYKYGPLSLAMKFIMNNRVFTCVDDYLWKINSTMTDNQVEHVHYRSGCSAYGQGYYNGEAYAYYKANIFINTNFIPTFYDYFNMPKSKMDVIIMDLVEHSLTLRSMIETNYIEKVIIDPGNILYKIQFILKMLLDLCKKLKILLINLNVVHLDLHSKNILFNKITKDIHIIDFGYIDVTTNIERKRSPIQFTFANDTTFISSVKNRTQQSSIKIAILYPPELLHAYAKDLSYNAAKTQIYFMGALFYELLTKKRFYLNYIEQLRHEFLE
ncbi:unnamed protein product, partial [Didymodactylos carnosus]